MIKNFNFSFYLRNSKTNKDGASAIYERVVTDTKKIFRYSSTFYVNSLYWDEKEELVKSRYPDADSINLDLDKLRNDLNKLRREMTLKNLSFDKPEFLLFLKGEREQGIKLLSFFETRITELGELNYSKSTIEVYNHCFNNLKKCFTYFNWCDDLLLHEFKYENIVGFESFLIKDRKCEPNTISKYQKTLKAVLNEAIKKDLINKNPFSRYPIKWVQAKREILTIEEVQKIHEKKFSINRVEEVKNIFLLSCFTGLAYIDIKNLTYKNLVFEDGKPSYLSFARQKTKKQCDVPLIDAAANIISDNLKNGLFLRNIKFINKCQPTFTPTT